MRNLRDAVAFHQLVLSASGASRLSQRQYLHFQTLFLVFLERTRIGCALEQLNPQRVREFLAWYRNQGGELAVRAADEALERLGGVLAEHDYVAENPLAGPADLSACGANCSPVAS